ncbi:MAG: adenylate/guanylate cyclase domain-containing protein [Pseudomonadota bacterium]|nr:adenylate/guanylate cyclase domain-containing protein [Pseudomonadota bacterium]
MKISDTQDLQERLVRVLDRNMDGLIEATVVAVRAKIDEYRARPAAELAASVRLCYHAYLDFLTTDSFVSLTDYITQMAQRRSDEQVRISAIQGVFLTFREVVMPVLKAEFEGDYEQLIVAFNSILQAESQALRVFADIYQDAFTARLRQANVSLAEKNRDLETLSNSLDRKVNDTTLALQQSRDFMEEILESLVSGIIVVDCDLNIKMFNRSMERLADLRRETVLGCRVDQVFASRIEIPFSFFQRQMEEKGVVEGVKLRIEKDDGRALYRHVRVEAWREHGGNLRGYIIIVDDITEQECLQHSLSCYVSPAVAEGVMVSGEPLRLTGQRMEVVVLFADLRGFSTSAQGLEPEYVVELLNSYLGVMVDVILRFFGTLDKFVGDGVMALFGAPAPMEDAAVKAVECAVEMQEEIGRLNRQRHRDGEPHLHLGIGVSCGEAIVGNIGSPVRMDFTAIGETVNLAARLQEISRGGEILVGEEVHRQVRDHFQIRALAPGVVKGIGSRVAVYVVEGYKF